ncbi:Holliday junction resolvase RuvX [Beggiatoa alba]|nr:Holliday junction resolvase RuvX [Beggiatoa alba]
MPANPDTILGFDYGTHKIGIAVGQSITQTVNPLVTLPCKNLKPDWHEIEKLIKEWQPDLLVVGYPLDIEGEEQAMTLAAKKFARQLNGRYQLPVELVDERFSSYEAKQRLQANNRYKKQTNKRQMAMDIDKIAAQLIVESWFRQ